MFVVEWHNGKQWCEVGKTCATRKGAQDEFVLHQKAWGFPDTCYRIIDKRSPMAHQSHYECIKPEVIDVMEGWTHLSIRVLLALKYLGRLGLKGTPEDAIKDLDKAITYLQREKNARLGEPAW